MDLKQRLEQLEISLEWYALADALEAASEGDEDGGEKSARLLQLGRLLNSRLLQGARALRYFQAAWKLHPESVEPLLEARDIYLGLGRVKMVETVLRRSLETAAPDLRGRIQLDLGDALQDLGNYEGALEAYQGAAESDDVAYDAMLAIEDLSVESDSFQDRIDELLGESVDQPDSAARVRLLLRAARLARRFGTHEQVEELLLDAYQADPENLPAAALYEGLFVATSEDDPDARAKAAKLAAKQRELIAAAPLERRRMLARVFGERWAQHQDVEHGVAFLRDAFRGEPADTVAYVYLREQLGAQAGDWAAVMKLLEGASEGSSDACPQFVLAEAGKTAWRQLGDVMAARGWFAKLAKTTPAHPDLAAFEKQLGTSISTPSGESASEVEGEDVILVDDEVEAATMTDDEVVSEMLEETRALDVSAGGDVAMPTAEAQDEARIDEASTIAVEEVADAGGDNLASKRDIEEVVEATEQAVEPSAPTGSAEAETADSHASADAAPVEQSATDEEQVQADDVVVDESAARNVTAASKSEPKASTGVQGSGVEDAALIAKLLDEADKQQKAKRSHDHVKTLVKLGEAYVDVTKKIGAYAEAAEIFLKFSNASEAAKCFEQILALDPTHGAARNHLREYYEKRRDWEKLIELMRGQADLLATEQRAKRYAEMAKLASDKVKKPQLCIDLWNQVRSFDPGNVEALDSLATLYERAREFQPLAAVLIELVDALTDAKEKLNQLQKLAQIQGEKLNDDAGAADAWQRVLELTPDDRRAQENLKKRLLSLQRWDDLEVLFEESGKWDELIRAIEAQEQKEKDDAAKVGLLLKIADLWLRKKDKADRAAKAYEKVLTLDESHLAAAEALVPIYRSTNNPKGLAQVLEVKLTHAADSGEQVALLDELGEIYETKLKTADVALARYLRAFTLSRRLESGDSAERVARATNDWAPLTAAYRDALEGLLSQEDAVAIRLRLGRVLLHELNSVDDALVQFRAVYELDPNNLAALESLERLYRETKRHAELLEVYEKQRQFADTPEAQARVLRGVALMQETELSQPEAAIDSYLQILELIPGDGGALAALDRLYFARSEWSEYVGVLRRRLEGDVDEAALIDLKFRLGEALERHLGDAATAVENYREILLIEPDETRSREALERLVDHDTLGLDVARILADVYEARSDFPKLVGSLQKLVQAETDSARRVELFRRIAKVTGEKLNDDSAAFTAASRALVEQPGNEDAHAELRRYAQSGERWEALVAVYSEVADALTDPALARSYGFRLAAIQEQLGAIDDAAKSYVRVLDADPTDAEALDALELLFANHERHADVIGVLRRRVALAEHDSEREMLLGQIATIHDEQLGQPDLAVAAYLEILGFDDRSQVALRSLDGLFVRLGRHEELAGNLEQQIKAAETEDFEIALMLRLGELQESKLALLPAAIETYRQVLVRRPNHEGATVALERLGRHADYEIEIAETLGPLYRAAGNYAKLIGVYEIQVRRAEDPARAVELLHEMAQLYEDAASEPSAAFDVLVRALDLEPGSSLVYEGLQRLAGATRRFADLAAVYEAQAAKQSDKDLAVALLGMSAAVFQHQLGASDRAVAVHRRILELEPTQLSSIEALELIFQQTDRNEELSAVLQQRAALLTSLEHQKAALFEAAALEEEVLGRVDHAIAVYRKVLEVDGDDLRALDSLVRLYLGLQRWQELLTVYAKKAELIVDADERKRVYYQAAAVYERELGDVRNAIDTYQRILELDPDDLEALGRLDALHQEAQDWPELLTVLQRQAELASDPREAIAYQFRIGEIYDRRLNDVVRALDLYRELVNLDPNHAPTVAALETLAQGTREPLIAAQILEPVYQTLGDWRRLVGVLEVQVARNDDAYARIELLMRIAAIHEDALGEHGVAFDTVARAVAIDSGSDDLLAHYERLAAVAGRWAELAALYDRQLTAIPADEPARFVELALRLARIFEEQLENWDLAIARYEAALERDADNVVAISALDRLYGLTERWQALAGILAREAGFGTADAPAFKFRLAQVQQAYLGDISGAIDSYGELLADDPNHEAALGALEALFNAGHAQLRIAAILEPHYEATGQFDYLAGVFEAVLAHTQEPAERLLQFHRLAELHEQRVGVPGAALAVTIRALAEAPSDERVLAELERLAGMVEGGWEHLANAYADVLGQAAAPEIQCALGKRLARVFEEELADVQRAEETYAYVLSIVPFEIDCLENLDRLYTAQGNAAALAAVLEQRVQTVEDVFAKIEFLTRLGELYELHLAPVDPRHYEDAIRVYRTVLEGLDAQNENAQVVLERIYGQAQRWPELYGVYERQLASAGGDFEKGEITTKMARIAGGGLGDVRLAIDLWKRVLEFKGEDGEALGALSELYERSGQWAELAEVLERHLANVVDEREHVAVLLRRARLHSMQLRRDDLALEDYARVLEFDFANLDALYAMSDIARRRYLGEVPHESRGKSGELLASLHQIADRAAAMLPAEHLLALYREMAGLHQLEVSQRSEAIDAWQKLLAVDPRDFDAMAQLEALLRADGAWRSVAELKAMRARALGSPSDQLTEYLGIAEIWSDRVGDSDGATSAYEAVLQLDPANDTAYAALERLHKAAGRWEALVELYVARVETRDDVHEQTALLRKVARVFEEEIGDAAQAYDSLETAFALDVTDDETVARLEAVTAATKRWPNLIQTANGLLEQATDRHLQVALCLRLAKWYGENLDRQDYAQPFYARVQELEPNNVQVRRQAASYLRKQGDWRGAGQRLEEALAFATRDADRAAILTDIGELLEKFAGQPEQGVARFERAIDVDPTCLPALEALERIYEARGQTSDLAGILERKIKALRDPEKVSETRMRVGSLYEGALGAPEKAISLYRGVLEHDAGNAPAIRGLERVFSGTHRFSELLEVLEMHLDVANTERERADTLMRIAALQEEEFRKPDLAAVRLEQVVDIDPTNVAAFEALARCYQKQQQWHELITCLDRFVQMVADRQKKIQLLTWQGQVHADHLQDQVRAMDAYLAIVDLDPHQVSALEALSKLYDRMDDPANAIDFMTRVAELTTDGGQRVEAFYRIGKQLEDKLGDRTQARARFEQALDLNPYHLPTLAAMRAIAISEADWYHATRYLETEQLYTESPRMRAKLLVELGQIRTEMMEQPEPGLQAYELAHQADPDNEDAALPLARAYVERGAFAQAEPLTDLLEKKAPSKDRERQIEFYLLHGRVELELGKGAEALRAFAAAQRVDIANRDAIRGLGDAYFLVRDWAGALTNYQKVLTALSDDEATLRAEILFKLGCVKREQGQGRQAINNFEKALQLEPSHRATLEALAAIHATEGDWAQSCVYRQLIIDTVVDGDERFKLYLELSDFWDGRVGDAVQALAAMEQAVAIKPEDHQLQHRLLALYQKTQRWPDVVQTLQRIADGDPSPQRRARYMFTMAQVFRDKLEDPYLAVEHFDKALDLHPELVDAFQRIDKVLSSIGDWAKLERAYRKMIHRVRGKGNAELEYGLFHALGLIYRDRLQDYAKASDAFRGALDVKPDAVEDRIMLAELAAHTGDAGNALDQYRSLLVKDPLNVDAYRSIYTLHLQQQSYDAAWCVAGVLAFMGRANEEEQRFYDDWKPQDISPMSGGLDGGLWAQHLVHADEDPHIGKIFEAVAPAALKAKIADLTARNQRPALPDQVRQDPATSQLPLAKTFFWAAKGLGVQAPQLYARTDQPGLLSVVPNFPLASVAGQVALQGLTPHERVFVCGKHLAMVKGEHLIKTLFPTVTELTVLLFGAVRLVAQLPAPPEYANQVQATTQALGQYIEPMQREALKVAVNEFMKAGARANIKRWAQAVETTAARAGLLLAGDLAVAKKVIVSEPQIPGDLTPQERLKELMLFAASDDYARLRKLLGLNIKTE